MIFSDFSSRKKHDESDLHEIIPISFNMKEVLHSGYYNKHESEQMRYLIQTRPQEKTSGTILSEVHGVDIGGDPNIKPEKQIIKPLITPVQPYVPTELKDQYHVKPN